MAAWHQDQEGNRQGRLSCRPGIFEALRWLGLQWDEGPDVTVVDVTVVDVHLLRRLAVRPSSTALLAEYLLCTHPTISRRLAVLEGSGLIERSPSYRDSRMNTLTLSEKGREVVQMVERAMDGLLDVIGDDVPPDHWQALLQDLDTLS